MTSADRPVDGIYSAYFTGMTGSTFALFAFAKGIVAGADAGGAVYDGTYREHSGSIEGEVTMHALQGAC